MTPSHTSFLQYPIELIIFDCDGVLIDSEIISKRVLLQMLLELDVVISDEYFEANFLGHSFEHVTAKILADFNVTLASSFSQDYQTKLMQVFAVELEPTVGLEQMLLELKVPYCVATSSSPQRVSRALDITRIGHYFADHVFTASEVENGKPAPDLFLHAAEKMGVAPQYCLVIEDSPAGIEGAKAAQMQVIRYAGAGHMQQWRQPVEPSVDNLTTIQNWQELYALAPTLNTIPNMRDKRG